MRSMFAVAVVALAGSAPDAAGQALRVSSTTARMLEDLETLSKGDRAMADRFFDQGEGRGANENLVAAKAGRGGFFSLAAAALGGLRLSAPPAPKVVSSQAGKQQCCTDTLQVSPDGTLYRLRADHAWWKFWDPGKVVERSAPGKDGALYNAKGEFVGEWQKVMSTTEDSYRVARGADGVDHVYTFKNNWGSREVYRDGGYLATFSNSWLSDASMAEVKVGRDDRLYARYARTAEDVILTVDPATKRQAVAARVPAEVEVRLEPEYHTQTHTDDDGDTHTTTTVEYHERVDRHGVSGFEVTRDGRVLTLFKGNVYEEGDRGSRRMLSGAPGAYSPLEKAPWGRTSGFTVDSHGNLYATRDGQVFVNGDAAGRLSSGGLAGRGLVVDDGGNVYKAEGFWKPVIRQYNVLSDPAQAERIAAPSGEPPPPPPPDRGRS